MKYLHFLGVWQEGRWLEDVCLAVDAQGMIQAVGPAPEGAVVERVEGYALPGFRNAHSHAFQYAMAGLAEHLRAPEDDFWSWREAMYHLALSLEPDQVEDVAAMLYAEMARNGYTAVAEFHYLHHDREGRPYANPAEMGVRLMAAAARAGIRLTLVPIYYRNGDFATPASERQRRFLHRNCEAFMSFWEATRAQAKAHDHVRMGLGIHSLRAAPPEDVRALFNGAPAAIPLHIHIAEQQREVVACIAQLGQRPVAWLLDQIELSPRHHLVHATHMEPNEVTDLARSGAVAVICPSTEGNLGDGFFHLRSFLEAGGNFAIGSDSHIGLSPAEELRWLDYGQRMRLEKRNVVCWHPGQDSADRLFSGALHGGQLSLGEGDVAALSVGSPLDALVLDANFPLLAHTPAERRLATYLYSGDASAHLGTLVGGQWIVRGGQHRHGTELRRGFRALTQKLRRS